MYSHPFRIFGCTPDDAKCMYKRFGEIVGCKRKAPVYDMLICYYPFFRDEMILYKSVR